MKKGRASTFTHDSVRHGTTTLFAALNVADGTVIGPCQARHRHIAGLKFLRLLDEQTPADRDLHLILDHDPTHKHPKVQAWLAKPPRFHLHFTPTRASWLNLVARFFRDLTTRRLRRGVCRSLAALSAAITAYLDHDHASPTPFVWTATASDILAKVKRARRKLHTPREMQRTTLENADGESATGNSAERQPGLAAKGEAVPKRTVPETPERWQTIAKGTLLPLVNPRSLALGQGVIELHELNPTEQKSLNEDLGEFLERVRTAEKRNAYVRVGADGAEEIVVPPFDRGPLVKKFREQVEKDLGKNVADFFGEQMRYDSSLALGNAEVRLYIEPKNESQPHDMLVISRGVHRRNTSGNPKWEGEAAPLLVTKTIAGKDFGVRYRHLHYLAQKNLLPRKREGAK